jgi:hypothetical protein
MPRVKLAVAAALALVAAAVGVVLSYSPLVVAGTNSVAPAAVAEFKRGDIGACQQAATIPAGTSAIRIALEARAIGPKVAVRVLSGKRVLTSGQRAAGWGPAPTVTVPVRRVREIVSGAFVCAAVGPTVEPFRVHGVALARATVGARTLGDVRLRIEYLRPGPRSWWSLSSSIAYHLGLGRAASGTWLAFLALALMITVAALAARLVMAELR